LPFYLINGRQEKMRVGVELDVQREIFETVFPSNPHRLDREIALFVGFPLNFPAR